MGRSRGGLTTKIHAVVDTNGLPVRSRSRRRSARQSALLYSPDRVCAHGTMLLADRGYDADWIRAFASEHGAWANIPPKRNRNRANLLQPVSLPGA